MVILILAWTVGILFSAIVLDNLFRQRTFDKDDLLALLVCALPIILSAMVIGGK